MPTQPASHVFFFSYAHENKDAQLEAFFEDLCGEVAPYTEWEPQNPKVSFRDGKNLPLMEEWRPALLHAIQTSAVLVCVTSPAFFKKRFCGQEHFIFDQRRRQGLQPGERPPSVILPIIWAPVPGGLPRTMDMVQWKAGDMPELYETKGLRYLKKLQPAEYERCVVSFAQAIKEAWLAYPNVEEMPHVAPFENMPSSFAGENWEEAADGIHGWTLGPGVANFVYAAGVGGELPQPPGRYGSRSSEWRPYLPPDTKTIAELAREIVRKHELKYREIAIDQYLCTELEGARNRKNLTIVVADAKTLPMQAYQPVTVFDQDPWEGTAVLMPGDGTLGLWTDQQLQTVVAGTFPVRSQAKAPPFQGPIPTKVEFEKTLDLTLTDLRAAVTRVEAEKKEKTDDPPTQVIGP